MAWTEQCKVAFKMNAFGKLSKYKNKSRKVRGVLKELSKESDIPFRTLENWYYEKTESIDREITEDKSKTSSEVIEIPMCERCDDKPVYLSWGKPLSQDSKYYGLCGPCRRNQQYIEIIDRQATDDKSGLMTVCPHCEKTHYMNIETKRDRKKGVKDAGNIS